MQSSGAFPAMNVTPPVERRYAVLDAGLGRAEVLSVDGLTRARMPAVHSPEFQVIFPLAGVFNWHLGSTCSLVDANQVLFIAAGDESQDSHPSVGDVEVLLATPATALLESVWDCDATQLAAERGFTERVLPSSPEVQQLAAAIVTCGRSSERDPGELEEAMVALLSATARRSGSRPCAGADGSAGALIGAVKEIVAAAEGRLSLAEVAGQLDRSPAYLTDLFRRSEGMPIARYHRRLRLARTLAELPHTDDITALALRFGFSSHAHFCSAFRQAFGRTPSDYRARARRRDLRSLLTPARLPST